MAGNDDSSVEEEVGHVVTLLEMQREGLLIAHYTEQRYARTKKHYANSDRFLECFGVRPATACTIYEDLQTTDIETAKIKGSPLELKYFLLGLYFLAHYPKESQMEPLFDYSRKWARDLVWQTVKRLQAASWWANMGNDSRWHSFLDE